MQDQTEPQLAHNVQSQVTLFGLECINRDKDTMTTKVGRMFFQSEMIRAAQQDQKHFYQVQHLSLGDRQVVGLGQHLVNLRDGPALPKTPVANLNHDFQCEATPTHGQAACRLRFIHAILPSAFRIGATVTQADDQVTPIQENDVLPPNRITTFQRLPAARASRLLGSVVALGHVAIVFCSSHRHTSLAQGLCKTAFYPAKGV